jgi:hypothetical protein
MQAAWVQLPSSGYGNLGVLFCSLFAFPRGFFFLLGQAEEVCGEVDVVHGAHLLYLCRRQETMNAGNLGSTPSLNLKVADHWIFLSPSSLPLVVSLTHRRICGISFVLRRQQSGHHLAAQRDRSEHAVSIAIYCFPNFPCTDIGDSKLEMSSAAR